MNKSWSELISSNARKSLRSTTVLTKKYFPAASRFSPSAVGATQNDLLASLPADELVYLMPYLEFVKLPFGKELHQHDERISHVYFPTTAIVASLIFRGDGSVAEIGVIGHEGLIGLSILMNDRAIGTARVQCEGFAYRLKASALKDCCERYSNARILLMRYMHASLSNLVLNSAFDMHSSIDQRLARWLLNRLDRSLTNVLAITQEMIGTMLSVRRESITGAANKMRNAGLIRYFRGSIVIVDRDGLEAIAGDGYTMARREFDLVLSETNAHQDQRRYAT